MDEVKQLEHAIQALEAQRSLLGDAVVEAALLPMREKLASLQRAQPVEERRLVTVLFADLVDFTAMSEKMDPEDVRDILDTYLARWAECIEAAGGVIEKFIGDAVMAVFGLTRAQEDDARRAILSALKMLAGLAGLNLDFQQRYGVQLAVRIGVHTGPVVVSTLGERKGHEFVAVGDTVNLASRLQSSASPNSILVSYDTAQQVHGWFDLESHPPIKVKGKSEPIRVYQVKALRQAGLRSQGRGILGAKPLIVGRQPELTQLLQVFEDTCVARKASMVIVSGDPGIGKSRLALEFENALLKTTPRPLLLKASADEQSASAPYWLLRHVFSQWCGILESDPVEVVREKFETCLPGYFNQDGLMKTHFIGSLLGFDFSTSPDLQGVQGDAQQLQERALLYLVHLFTALSNGNSPVVVLDDIHWADEASLLAMQHIIEHCQNQPLLLLCLSRLRLQDAHPQWYAQLSQASYHLVWLTLKPLSEADSQQILSTILSSTTQAARALQEIIIENAGGNPFYLEEIVKMLIDEEIIQPGQAGSGWKVDDKRLPGIRVPATLTAVLQARLDSLPVLERTTLQQAAVIGRVFWDRLLAEMQGSIPMETELLAHLTRREMITLQPISMFSGCREYHFSHVLLWEVVYETILKKKRRLYHKMIGAWLGRVAAETGRQQELAAQVAQHFALGEEPLQASTWYLLAAKHAGVQGALRQALRFLEQSDEHLPAGEIGLRWQIAVERMRLLGETGDLSARKREEAQLLELAHILGEDACLATAYEMAATTRQYSGDYPQAIAAADQAIIFARRAGRIDLEASASAFKITCLTRLGDFEQAALLVDPALEAAQQQPDEILLARTMVNISLFYSAIGDFARVQELLECQVAICDRLGNLVGAAVGANNLGYNYILVGIYAKAQQALEHSLRIAIEIGAQRDAAYTRLNLGLNYLRQGSTQMAHQFLECGIAALQEIGDRFGSACGIAYQAQVYEQQGNLIQAISDYKHAGEIFTQDGMAANAMDTQTGLARACLQLSVLSQAYDSANQVWEYLATNGSGALEFPIEAYLACADVFSAHNSSTAEQAALQAGVAELTRRAEQISDPATRESYVRNVPAHARILARIQGD